MEGVQTVELTCWETCSTQARNDAPNSGSEQACVYFRILYSFSLFLVVLIARRPEVTLRTAFVLRLSCPAVDFTGQAGNIFTSQRIAGLFRSRPSKLPAFNRLGIRKHALTWVT
jgi:hypothetical protein